MRSNLSESCIDVQCFQCLYLQERFLLSSYNKCHCSKGYCETRQKLLTGQLLFPNPRRLICLTRTVHPNGQGPPLICRIFSKPGLRDLCGVSSVRETCCSACLGPAGSKFCFISRRYLAQIPRLDPCYPNRRLSC